MASFGNSTEMQRDAVVTLLVAKNPCKAGSTESSHFNRMLKLFLRKRVVTVQDCADAVVQSAQLRKYAKKRFIEIEGFNARTASIAERRGKPPQDLEARARLKELVETNQPVIVRQMYYLMAGEGWVQKDTVDSGKGYQQVSRWLKQARDDARFLDRHPELAISDEFIIDTNRRTRQSTTFSDMKHALESLADGYRLSVIDHADIGMEITVEKDGLAMIAYREAVDFDVRVTTTKGFCSASQITQIAERINDAAEQGKPFYIFHFGDYNWEGEIIATDMENKLKDKFATWIDAGKITDMPDFEVERVALTKEQIDEYEITPITRTNSNNVKETVCDLDAMPPQQYRQLVRRTIMQHAPESLVKKVRKQEAKQRRELEKIAAKYRRSS